MNNVQFIRTEGLPKGDYAKHVITHGHQVGVLTGTELKGKAKQFGLWYAKKRNEVFRHLANLGVYSALVLHPKRHRWVRVWVDKEGEPVIVKLDNVIGELTR